MHASRVASWLSSLIFQHEWQCSVPHIKAISGLGLMPSMQSANLVRVLLIICVNTEFCFVAEQAS